MKSSAIPVLTLAFPLACCTAVPALADIVPPRPQLAAEAPPSQPDTTGPLKDGTFDPSPFSIRREIAAPTSHSGLFAVAVDPGLFRESGSGFASLRLAKEVDGSLVELPWITRRVHVRAAAEASRRLPHHIESFADSPDGAIEIVVRLDDGGPTPARLEIATPLRDFEKGVSISIPGNDGSWTEWLRDGVIFDHSRFLDYRHTTIPLPKTSSRRFRIRLADATDEQQSRVREITRAVSDAAGLTVSETSRVETRAFRIDELRFYSAPVKAEKGEQGRESHAMFLLEKKNNSDGTTHLLLDGGSLPLDRFTFVTEDRNFRRAVSVQIPASGGSWHTIHRGTLHRYGVGDFRDESLDLVFPEIRSDRIRVVVENGKNPPVEIRSITGEGPSYEILFLADPGERAFVFLGGDASTLPDHPLDVAAIQAALGGNVKPVSLALGAPAENPHFHPAATPPLRRLDSPTILWTLIAIAVAVLLWVLFGTVRNIESGDGGEASK